MTPPPGDAAAPASGPARKPDLSPAETARQLAELFPALFGATPKPIKLRIQADIQARAPGVFSRRVLSFFLGRHTTTTPYIKALLAAEQRFDLDGNPAGEISEEHRAAARTELERRQQIVQARRAAERAARPGGPGRRPADGPRPGAGGGPRGQARAAAAPAGEGPAAVGSPAATGPEAEGRAPAPAGDHAAGSGRDRRPARERGDRPDRAPRGDRPPRQDRRAHDDRPHGRPGHGPDRPPAGRGGERPRPDDARGPRPAPREAARPEAALPQDPAQRERALLLRAWEASPLTKANFCTLKRLREADFDVQIEQARQERDAARRG